MVDEVDRYRNAAAYGLAMTGVAKQAMPNQAHAVRDGRRLQAMIVQRMLLEIVTRRRDRNKEDA